MPMFNHLLFIGQKTNETQLIEAVGDEFVRKRGNKLKTWLDGQFKASSFENGNVSIYKESEAGETETRISEPMVEQCEPIGGL